MASFNKVILIGNITADLELKYTRSEIPVTSFTIGVARRYSKGEEKQTDFINIVGWRNTAEFICKYFQKGDPILVVGSIQTRSWVDQNGQKRYATEVVAEEAHFVCGKAKSDQTQQTPSAANKIQNMPYCVNSAVEAVEFEEMTSDEDLPF